MQLLIRRPDLRELADAILCGFASDDQLARAKIEDVRAIKESPVEHYCSGVALSSSETQRARSKRYVASDETVDRMGDIIRVKGWELARFRRNPVALFGHDSRKFPVGTVSDMVKGEHNGSPALLETIDYAEEGTDPVCDTLWKLIDQGVIRAVSVGFIPMKTSWVDDPEERKKLGLGPWGVVYEKQEQIELSNCSIPANPNALATKSVDQALSEMVALGEITQAVARSVADLSERKRTVFPVAKVDQDEWVFSVDDRGRLVQTRQVKGPDGAVIVAERTQAALESTEDTRIEEVLQELRAMRKNLDQMPGLIESAVSRALQDRRGQLRTALRTIVATAQERLNSETR